MNKLPQPSHAGTFPATELLPAQLRQGRRFAVQFVYQLEVNKQFYFRQSDMENFFHQCEVPTELQKFIDGLARGVGEQLAEIDKHIETHAKNWKLSRISKVDLATLRVCTFEILNRKDVPAKVILADAAEIGKSYGTEGSSSFINGVLDAIANSQNTV